MAKQMMNGYCGCADVVTAYVLEQKAKEVSGG